MKLISALAVWLILPVFLCGGECRDEMFDKTNNMLQERKSAAGLRLEKEKILNSLKSREAGSFWDIAARNSREKMLLRRNRLSMEISSLQDKENALSALIAGTSLSLSAGASKCASDPEFGGLYTEVMSVSVSLLMSKGFLSHKEAEQALAAAEGREFLKYRAEIQSNRIEEVSEAIEGLKTAKKAFMEADMAVPAAVIEGLIGELNIYLKNLYDSNNRIKELLKTK